MKSDVRRTFSVFLLLFSFIFLFSCGKETSYADGIPCRELMTLAEEKAPSDLGYTDFGETQILYEFGDLFACDDFCLRYSTRSENINEIGILHTRSEEEAEAVEETIRSYLARMEEEQSAFIGSYAPEELPKLEKASIRRLGNYTVYMILSEEDQAAVLEALHQRLSSPQP